MEILLNTTETKKAMEIAKELKLNVAELQEGEDMGFRDGYASMNNNQLKITMFPSAFLKMMDSIHNDILEVRQAREAFMQQIFQESRLEGFLGSLLEHLNARSSTEEEYEMQENARDFFAGMSIFDKASKVTDCDVKKKDSTLDLLDLKQTCNACPSQWEGMTSDGQYIYIRYRHGSLVVMVGETNDLSTMKTIFEKNLDVIGLDGYLTTNKMLDILRREKVVLA